MILGTAGVGMSTETCEDTIAPLQHSGSTGSEDEYLWLAERCFVEEALQVKNNLFTRSSVLLGTVLSSGLKEKSI